MKQMPVARTTITISTEITASVPLEDRLDSNLETQQMCRWITAVPGLPAGPGMADGGVTVNCKLTINKGMTSTIVHDNRLREFYRGNRALPLFRPLLLNAGR